MNDLEKSEKLCKSIEALARTLPGNEAEEEKAIRDPALQQVVLTLLTAEKILDSNDPRIKELWGVLNSRREMLDGKKRIYRAEYSRLSKELEGMTRPVINSIIEDFRIYLVRLKVDSEIIDSEYKGFSKTTVLTVKSNKNAVLAVRKMISEAEKTIQGMRLQSIAVIQAEGSRLQKEFESVDFRAETVEEIDEDTYYRFTPPQGIDKDYSGPRTRL